MTEPLRLLLVDDEPPALRRLETVLRDMADVEIVGTAGDGVAALDEARRLMPDLIILDVEMPGRNGLSVAAELGHVGAIEIVIFSAFDRYAAPAFDVDALDYLLKPLRPERLRQALDRARRRRAERFAHAAAVAELTDEALHVIHIPDRHGGHDVPVKEVVWIEAARDYALIHTRTRSHILRATMTDLRAQLPDRLLRVHRSAFVALPEVRRWGVPVRGVNCLIMSDGTEVAVGPSYLVEARQALRSLLS